MVVTPGWSRSRSGWTRRGVQFNYNLVVMDNTFTGNPTLTNVNGAFGYVDACDGLVWFQGGGNWFVRRNAITNNLLEAIQFNAGPAAAVGNYLNTRASRSSSACRTYAAAKRLSWHSPAGADLPTTATTGRG